MKLRIVIILSLLLLGAMSWLRWSRCSVFSFRPAAREFSAQRAMAQQPRRWIAGDTLWLEVDSIPLLPSDWELMRESLQAIYPMIDWSQLLPDTLRWGKLPSHITIDYKLPYWSVYRRSVKLWGITFSVGQISPYVPYPQAIQEATVLSFPLQRPN